MKKQHLLVVATGLALAGTVAMSAQNKNTRLYSWTDEHGVTHYSDTIPPDQSGQARRELNQQGVTVRELPRQMTPAEAKAAEQAAAEENRRKVRDDFLLHTYTRVSDIEQWRDERIALIDGQMELSRITIASIDQNLSGLQDRLRKFRPYSPSANAKRVPDQIAVEVVRKLSERRSLVAQLEKFEEDKVTQQRTFGEDIARYKELTAGK